MSDKQIPPENQQPQGQKDAKSVDSSALPHCMIAITLTNYIATIYDIYNFSTIPLTAEGLYMLKLESPDEDINEALQQVLGDIRNMVFQSPLFCTEDMMVFGFQSLEDFVPLLKQMDKKVMENLYDQKQAEAQALPQGEDLVAALKTKGDPFAFPLLSDDRAYFSAKELAANMLANFKTFAGMPDRYCPPVYSIAIIERAVHTANNPSSNALPHFRLH